MTKTLSASTTEVPLAWVRALNNVLGLSHGQVVMVAKTRRVETLINAGQLEELEGEPPEVVEVVQSVGTPAKAEPKAPAE